MKIGIFDSGIGGKAIANVVAKSLPNAELIYVSDEQNSPYGQKSIAELKKIVIPQVKKLSASGCDAVIIACNTVTTNIIKDIRNAVKAPVIGIEPMIKPACVATKSNIVAVCATPATLNSARYAELKKHYAKDIKIIEPDCSNWASMIESKKINKAEISEKIKKACMLGADVIVLGCTHYHWIEKEVKSEASKFNAAVIQPEEAVVSRLMQVLELRL